MTYRVLVIIPCFLTLSVLPIVEAVEIGPIKATRAPDRAKYVVPQYYSSIWGSGATSGEIL